MSNVVQVLSFQTGAPITAIFHFISKFNFEARFCDRCACASRERERLGIDAVADYLGPPGRVRSVEMLAYMLASSLSSMVLTPCLMFHRLFGEARFTFLCFSAGATFSYVAQFASITYQPWLL